MEEKEIWKDITGYEGYYMVSNMGNVKSLNYRHTGKEGILKAGKDKDSYLQVNLWKDGKMKTYKVHQLVAQAFLSNPQGYKELNHRDEDKTNNCVENLEWCTSQYNKNYGTRNNRVAEKLSKPVIAIDKITGLIVEFPSAHEAERKLGINNGNIIRCCQGKLNSCGGFYWMFVNDDNAE